MKVFISMLCAVLFNTVTGSVLGATIGLSPMEGATAMNVVAGVVSCGMPDGVLREGVFRELWTGQVVKTLRGFLDGTWLDGIPDMSADVDSYDTLHLVADSIDPEVIINNTEFPIPVQTLTNDDIPVKLDSFTTKVTAIKDDELHAVSFDKMGNTKDHHAHAIAEAKFRQAAHMFCGSTNTAKTPVLKTTGAVEPGTGRKRLTPNDVVALKSAMDNLGVPADNRRLVLCNDHANDLLLADESFARQYNLDVKSGKIAYLYGFEIYQFNNTPLYTTGGKKKKLTDTATTGEFRCSFAFYKERVLKAAGSTEMFYRDRFTDPEYQRSTINFKHWFVAMPSRLDSTVVMMSDYQA